MHVFALVTLYVIYFLEKRNNIFTTSPGSVLEQNNDTFTIEWLWLNADNTVQIKKGYMRDILKAYLLSPP